MGEDPPSTEPQENQESSSENSTSFWAELKRRKVMRVAITYGVVAWLLIQVSATVFPQLGLPVWAPRMVTLLLLIGFPIALIITWAFELTPEGIRTTRNAREERRGEPVSKKQIRNRNWVTLGFAAALPTLIFGSLAIFIFIRSGAKEVEANSFENSIAVMPLVNMSSHEENVHFAGGIHEDVLTNLSRIKGLQVKSRTSMLKYAASGMTLSEIGKELGAKYIVEGSVRRIGNHVRVAIQLIDARNENHLWANNFERELVDVFATQSELAKEISNSLHLEIQPESVGKLEGMPTTSVKAYDLYTRSANIEKTEGETEGAMIRRREMLEQAVAIDPEFVEAWAVLKRVYDLMLSRIGQRGWYLKEGQDREKLVEDLRVRSRRALDKAIALDPNNVETLLSKAVDHIWPQPDEVNQERKAIFDRIIATHPEHAMSWYHLGWWYWNGTQSQEVEALAAFEEALEHDPFNARIVRGVLTRYRLNGDQENVTRLVERLTQIVPETAADRSLARVSGSHMISQLVERFLAKADEGVLADIETYRSSAEFGKSDLPIYIDIDEMQLSVYTNDENRIIELYRKPIELGISEHNTMGYCRLASAGLVVQLNRGRLNEARTIARRIMEVQEIAQRQLLDEVIAVQEALGFAHVALGEFDEARIIAEDILESGTVLGRELGIRIMSHVDPERAVDFAFAELASNPDWNGFDALAARHVYCRPFLAHPKVQEYYVNQGKWIDYLSTRVPEYAQYKQQ